MSRTFDETLLTKLCCPFTRTPLRYDRDAQELISDAAGLAYPIRGGVAVMLVEEARPTAKEEAAPEGDTGAANSGGT